ncbi:MAG: Flagellar motor switch protein FliN [Firmicutes bacterium]|nr:Flagellar motor switch protein FliN [Bacillota bacterium]MDI6704680.1 flagellar motor switch phosphatase FliY [Bacillota bacterium]
MNEILSQDEIDALLKMNSKQDEDQLSPEEIDALGEIGNISMGTSATTLYTLLGNKVTITTPRVEIIDLSKISQEYPLPFIAIKVQFTEGLEGLNLLLLKERDALIIADLMMGGDGSNYRQEIDDLTMSAISEAMNQMIGSASTSLSTMLDKPINISPPIAFRVDLGSDYEEIEFFQTNTRFAKIAFKMVVGNLIDSEIMQLLPLKFAKEMVTDLMEVEEKKDAYGTEEPVANKKNKEDGLSVEEQQQKNSANNVLRKEGVRIQPVSLKELQDEAPGGEKENIKLILDVPLQVTVELGRTKKQIREILQFGVGTIVELDKLAGEPVDIQVNGKFIAKGEVVVIDESFGVRITDIVHPAKRISSIPK